MLLYFLKKCVWNLLWNNSGTALNKLLSPHWPSFSGISSFMSPFLLISWCLVFIVFLRKCVNGGYLTWIINFFCRHRWYLMWERILKCRYISKRGEKKEFTFQYVHTFDRHISTSVKNLLCLSHTKLIDMIYWYTIHLSEPIIRVLVSS